MNVIKKSFLLLCIIHIPALMCMDRKALVVIPGQNGTGGQNLTYVLPQFEEGRIYHVETPSSLPDLGQNKCMSYLKKTMASQNILLFTEHVIMHASSQGTATAMNHFEEIKRGAAVEIKGGPWRKDPFYAQQDHSLKKVKALILESVLLTGNSAIEHTARNRQGISFPGSYYCLPYITKIIFPFYAPAGQQAIFACDSLPLDLPIIILHAPEDPQLSFRDAQALYAYLKYKGNKNVYFMSIQDGYHILLIKKGDQETKVLQAILYKYNLLPDQTQYTSVEKESLSSVDLIPYQPEEKQEWLDHFHNLRNKEKRIQKLDYAVKGTFLAFICYIFYMHNLLGIF
jgi:hypothetical protein